MKQTKSTALYATPFSKAYWRDAAAELRDTRMLVFAALMIALRVALKSLGIPIAADLKINVAFFINAFGAMTFGPVVAILAAAVSDTLGCILFPTGAYFFPFIFIEIAGSLIFALFLYRAKVTATRVILSRFCIDFFVNIVMNAPIMWVYYKMVLGKSYTLFQLPRIIKNLALFPLEAVLLIAVGVGCVAGYFVYNFNTKNHASSLSSEEVYAINSAVTDAAGAQGLLQEGQIAVVNKVYKKLKGDTTVEFNVYDTTADTDASAASRYLAKNAKEDESLTEAGSGTVTLVLDDTANLTGLDVKLE